MPNIDTYEYTLRLALSIRILPQVAPLRFIRLSSPLILAVAPVIRFFGLGQTRRLLVGTRDTRDTKHSL